MNQTKATIDHDEIRHWAEARSATPARVKRTGGPGDVGMIRLDFPGYSGKDSLEAISWEDFFDKFEEGQLALVYRESLARGGKSNFNKLVGRETVDISRHSGRRTALPRRRAKAQSKAAATSRSAAPKRGGATKRQARAASTGTRAGRASATASTSTRSARKKSPSAARPQKRAQTQRGRPRKAATRGRSRA